MLDDVGTGKTTVIYRISHDLVRRGQPVLTLHTLSKIDAHNTIECIASATSPVVLLVDGLADHADQILELLEDSRTVGKIVVLAAERSYRQEYVDIVLGGTPRLTRSLQPLTLPERKQLVELFRQYGLLGDPKAIRDPSEYAHRLKDDPPAIAVCRILNDFRPLESIVESMWSETPTPLRIPYLCVALARYCHVAGIRYSILQSVVGPRVSLPELFTSAIPLRLAENSDDDDYVVPLNSVIGDRVLHRTASKGPRGLLAAFTGIAGALAPHVNRRAIMLRSPEARLAGRLFDADKVVKPLLRENTEEFYLSCQKEWAWNSRYWEQRALLAADFDLDTALHYARHAVAIEVHPFTLTTLGKILFRSMERDPAGRTGSFSEAFDRLSHAIKIEGYRSRISVHPFATLFSGATRYIEIGEAVTPAQRDSLTKFADQARHHFQSDEMLQSVLTRLDALL